LLKYWAPLYLYAGFIFFMSSIPKPLPRLVIPHLDKILHLIEYTIFGLLAARAFKNSHRKSFVENFKILAILAAILYGISDEFHQYFVAIRQFSVADMIADGIGGALGAFYYGRNHSA